MFKIETLAASGEGRGEGWNHGRCQHRKVGCTLQGYSFVRTVISVYNFLPKHLESGSVP
jgi:hypothetical protein